MFTKCLRTSVKMLFCFAVTAFLIELASSLLFHSNLFTAAFQKTWADKVVLQNRILASFRLSDKQIKMLKYPPTSRYNLTVLYSDPVIKINALFSKEFYVGDQVYLVDNPDEADFYKNRLKEQHASYYPDTDAFVAGLKEHLKGKKLIVTFGGSTTAWSFNWPFFLSQILEERYPGKFLVLNAGEPGHISWEHGFVIQSILDPVFKQEGIKPSLYLFMDGTNDTLLGTYWHIAYKLAEKLKLCTINKEDYLDPGQIYFPLYKNPEKSTGVRMVQDIENMVFHAMPYTSLILWRVIPTIGKPSAPAAGAAAPQETANLDCNTDSPNFLNGNFINSHKAEISEIATIGAKYHAKTLELSQKESGAIQQFFRKGIDFSIKASGDVPFYYFLQPEATESFYSLIPKRTEMALTTPIKPWSPSVDYSLRGAGLNGLITDVFYDIDQQYVKNVEMFKELNQTYPNRFYSIADLFKPITDIKKDPYSADAIHYGVDGSAKIGERIFSLLDQQNVFSKLTGTDES